MNDANNSPSPWQIWSYDVQQRLQAHEEQLERLKCQINELCGKMKVLEERPTYNIESISYNFDQLKIEKLEGTLNIGMSAPDLTGEAAETEQFGKGKGQPFPYNGDGLTVHDIRQPSTLPAQSSGAAPDARLKEILLRLDKYLNEDAVQKLLQLEAERDLTIDPHHRQMIIDDIKRQIPDRAHYYLQQIIQADENSEAAAFEDLVIERVVAKTSRDADSALLSYIMQLQNNARSPEGRNK